MRPAIVRDPARRHFHVLTWAFLAILLAAHQAPALVNVKLNDPLVSGWGMDSFKISPDSTRVVYHADQDADYELELYSVPIGGGGMVKLNDPLIIDGAVSSFKISPDSSRVVY